MANAFVVSMGDRTAGERIGITLATRCELDAVLSRVDDPSLIEDLRRSYPDGTCYAWAVPEKQGDNLAVWNAMAPGDLVLWYGNRSIVSASYVLAKTNDPALAAGLWRGRTEEPPGLICFTDKPHTGEVPIVPQMFRYLDPEFRGFARLASEKVGNILNDYGSFETFVQLCLMYDFPFSFRHS